MSDQASHITHHVSRFAFRASRRHLAGSTALGILQTMEKAVPRLEKEARIVKEKRAAYENAPAVQKCLEAGDTLYAGHAAYGAVSYTHLTLPTIYSV